MIPHQQYLGQFATVQRSPLGEKHFLITREEILEEQARRNHELECGKRSPDSPTAWQDANDAYEYVEGFVRYLEKIHRPQ